MYDLGFSHVRQLHDQNQLGPRDRILQVEDPELARTAGRGLSGHSWEEKEPGLCRDSVVRGGYRRCREEHGGGDQRHKRGGPADPGLVSANIPISD